MHLGFPGGKIGKVKMCEDKVSQPLLGPHLGLDVPEPFPEQLCSGAKPRSLENKMLNLSSHERVSAMSPSE